MPSVVALRRYLVFVAGLRLMSGSRVTISVHPSVFDLLLTSVLTPHLCAVYIGWFHPHRLSTNLFDKASGSGACHAHVRLRGCTCMLTLLPLTTQRPRADRSQ